MIRVLVVGCGYWGPNLVRNLVHCPHTTAAAVCDRDPRRLEQMRRLFPWVQAYAELDQALDAPIDAVVIATPVSTHHPIAVRCLNAGKHVLVEKPLALTSAEGQDLIDRAERAGRVLMVDHTFLYSGAVRTIKALLEAGELGDIYYVDSVRINLGLVQPDINVVWDLAPHDLSIIDYLLGQWPRTVGTAGKAHVNRQADVAQVSLDYDSRLLAGLHVNWLSPVKIRHMVIGGSRKSLLYNDLEPTEKVRVYDRGVQLTSDPNDKRCVMIDYRSGDMWCPHVGTEEPLQGMVRHFAECILKGQTPLSDGASGLRILHLLEAADRSLALGGVPVAPADLPVAAEIEASVRCAA